jgi:hypothetical protein
MSLLSIESITHIFASEHEKVIKVVRAEHMFFTIEDLLNYYKQNRYVLSIEVIYSDKQTFIYK